MPGRPARWFWLSMFLFPLASAFARQGEVPALPPSFNEPMPLYTSVLGEFTRPISTTNPDTQAYFNQGFQMMYAFTKEDAARSFREAQKHDPDCAICYWGEAWAWGSYLNGRMTKEEAPRAYAALQNAVQRLGKHTRSWERVFIEALAVRYVEDYDPEDSAVQDTLYAEAMRKVAAAFPEDLDAATLYAEALFLLEPRLGVRDLDDPDVRRLHQVLEQVLAVDIRHPGACHLYIHATESTRAPGKAEACAEYLGQAIPGASHINHMPSHTWNEIGRWGDAVRANIQAWHSDLKADVGEGFAIYPLHNLAMLLFAASMDGQGALAIQAGKDYAKLTGNPMHHVLTLVRFGRFEEVLAVDRRPEHPVHGGLWDFAQGYARLRTGEADFARVYLERVLTAADTSEAVYRFHPAKYLLGTVGGILEGALYQEEGARDEAIQAFERAVALEDSLQYDEPEPLPFSARHWLGAALLDAERYQDAERVYRAEIDDHPHNGWSLLGLKQALEAQGKDTQEVEKDWTASWARADTWIRASRF